METCAYCGKWPKVKEAVIHDSYDRIFCDQDCSDGFIAAEARFPGGEFPEPKVFNLSRPDCFWVCLHDGRYSPTIAGKRPEKAIYGPGTQEEILQYIDDVEHAAGGEV